MNKKIATITFNPAIDETVYIDNFTSGSVNRVQYSERHAGGKGINVATFITDYGMQAACTGFLGKDNESVFVSHFKNRKILDSMVRIPGETRTGIKIVDSINSSTTDINYPGILPTDDDIRLLFERIEVLLKEYKTFVVSGSLPDGTSPTLIREVVSLLKNKGAFVAVDTSGEAFKEAIKASPDLIKPNNHELEEYSGRLLPEITDLIFCSEEFIHQGISTVIVSMGKEGALFLNDNKTIHAKPPLTNAISTVGAGDAMVAGTICGLSEGKEISETAKLATAFSLNAISHVKPGLNNVESVRSSMHTVTVKNL
jgi:1-phosphofructokinase